MKEGKNHMKIIITDDKEMNEDGERDWTIVNKVDTKKENKKEKVKF